MITHRFIRTFTCAAALGAPLAACGTPDKQPAPVPNAAVPMVPPAALPMTLASNYGFMSIQFHLGDVRMFVSNFADTARLSAPGYGVLRGRDSIAIRFAGEGKRLTVQDFQRQPAGFQVEGRTVLDSGTYTLVTTLPLPKGTLDAKGRYWTRWLFTKDGRWLILSDSLAPAKR